MDVLKFPSSDRRRLILLTTYFKDAVKGRNLGSPGYSYEFVTKLFMPLLQTLGPVLEIKDPARELDAQAERARANGLEPIHLCFRAFQDAIYAQRATNVVVPAWEFPDVPDHPFDGNDGNDWVAMGNRADLILVGGPFTKQTFEQAGIRTPIAIVPVPTPADYFKVPAWDASAQPSLDCRGLVFAERRASLDRAPAAWSAQRGLLGSWKARGAQAARQLYKRLIRRHLPRRWEKAFTAAWLAGESAWRRSAADCQPVQPVPLSGVVYTSLFSPCDGRKNWQDLLTGFLLALGDRPDATLVLKLITSEITKANEVLDYYQDLDLPHRCKVVFLTDYLSDADMVQLAQATTYYFQTTRAEGNGLPLMNYLAAARPAVSPRHSALGDYFDRSLGFVIQSHPEPCVWPHDSKPRCRTSWHRLVWPSIVDQLQASYALAKTDVAAYHHLANRARKRLDGWASPDQVKALLRHALDSLAQTGANQRRLAA